MFSIALGAIATLFALAYVRECGRTDELAQKLVRIENRTRPDDGIVIEVDFRRH